VNPLLVYLSPPDDPPPPPPELEPGDEENDEMLDDMAPRLGAIPPIIPLDSSKYLNQPEAGRSSRERHRDQVRLFISRMCFLRSLLFSTNLSYIFSMPTKIPIRLHHHLIYPVISFHF
jgi:hypothetical protein